MLRGGEKLFALGSIQLGNLVYLAYRDIHVIDRQRLLRTSVRYARHHLGNSFDHVDNLAQCLGRPVHLRGPILHFRHVSLMR